MADLICLGSCPSRNVCRKTFKVATGFNNLHLYNFSIGLTNTGFYSCVAYTNKHTDTYVDKYDGV